MKITFSYSPDEQKQVNTYKKMIMKEAAPYSMRIKQGQEVDQHGRKRLYMTTRTEQETERIKAKEMAAGVKAITRQLDKMERGLMNSSGKKNEKPILDFQNDVKRLKKHFENK